jgi:hypothetical protein
MAQCRSLGDVSRQGNQGRVDHGLGVG